MLDRWRYTLHTYATSHTPWTNVYGLARTLLAIGTLLTFLFSHSSSLFRPAAGISEAPVCSAWFSDAALFCQFPPDALEIPRWLCVGALLLVVSGWRPRITGILHWYIAWSFNASAMMLDGGDQVTVVLTTLLLPLTLTDPRRWHWQRCSPTRVQLHPYQSLIALSTLWMLRLQVAGIYFHAAIGKFSVEEWLDGTAVYYWFLDPMLGVAPWLKQLLLPVLYDPLGITLMTWGPLLLELILFAALFMDRKRWPLFLVLGIIFHASIAVAIGLYSFACAMSAALILYLRHYTDTFPNLSWNRLTHPFRHLTSIRDETQPVPSVAPVSSSS